MKTLVLVPDPATAYGFGEMLASMPGTRPRVIAYGSATAAALPEGLDTFVYPIRDGSRLPAPFLDALVEHEQPDVILAPAGSTGISSAPVLLVDLDPQIELGDVVSLEDGSVVGWIEAVTGTIERRSQLLRAGLFSVDYLPNWFADAGKLAASAAGPITARLADLANLAGSSGSSAKRSEPVESVRIPVSAGTESSSPPPSGATTPSAETPVVDATVEAVGIPVAEPVQMLAPEPLPVPQTMASAPLETEPSLGFELAPEPIAQHGTTPETLDLAGPERYHARNAGATALVLASLQGLDALTPGELAHATVIAVPETLAWLTARMGLAQFVCVGQEPRSAEASAALSTTRTVVVHSDHLVAETLAPRARACVALHDLSRSGGPSLGWSDELQQGYFPAGGDAALALQWAMWIGAGEVIVAGIEPLAMRPGWNAFWKGTQQLLTARGITLVTPGTAVPAMSIGDAVDRLGGPGRS